ncbi:MAG TPA: rhodanese-like domain-containing protein, partial [Gemmatimonadaceae bacterium]|nr:rhodanese-like domain-containing protein [Gemmatimonadaceae bacterium]
MGSVVRSLGCLALIATTASAQTTADPRDALVVSTAWLAQHLKDPGLVVLFLGDDNEYNKQHIPGSYNVQIEDIAYDTSGLNLQVLPAERLREKLGAFGITNRSRIVVAAGKDFLEYGTRAVLTLDRAGLGDRTSLLDGGTAAWIKEGKEVSAVVPPKRPSALEALQLKPIIVDAEFVKAHVGKAGVSIVDGRAPAFYQGVSTGGGQSGQHRPGHIPSAKSVPYTSPYSSDGFLLPTAELRALFEKAGVAPRDTVIGYCHIGLQATAMLFAARVARASGASVRRLVRGLVAAAAGGSVSGRNGPSLVGVRVELHRTMQFDSDP